MTDEFPYKIETTKKFGQILPDDLIRNQVDVKHVTNQARTIVLTQGLGKAPLKRRHDALAFHFLDKARVVLMLVETQDHKETAMKTLEFLQKYLEINEDHQLPRNLPQWEELITNLFLRMNEHFFTDSLFLNAKLSLVLGYLKRNDFYWTSIGKNHIFHFDLTRKTIDPFSARINYPRAQFLPADINAEKMKARMESGHLTVISNHSLIIASDGVISARGGIEVIRSHDLFQIIRHKRTALSSAHEIVKKMKEIGSRENFAFITIKT